MSLKNSIQGYLRRQGVEVRKIPAASFQPVQVFVLAIQYLMAKNGPELRFVQVGANDGRADDPIYPNVAHGAWRGILVEPQPSVFLRLQETYRPFADRVIFENVAISPDEQSVDLFMPPNPTTVDSFTVSANKAVAVRSFGVAAADLVRLTVPAMTLDGLLAKHGMTHFDVLQIDTEGYDCDVLKTLDLSRTRPSVIQFEHGHLSRANCSEAAAYLSRHNYQIYWGGHQTDTVAIEGSLLPPIAI